MNTIESPTPEQSVEKGTESGQEPNPKISGFDCGTKSILREPSLYVSIAIIFIVAAVSLNTTPTVFWLSVTSLSGLAIAFHLLAERWLFKFRKEQNSLDVPMEGIFVVTLGAILPGLGLLAYGVHSLSVAPRTSLFEEFVKLTLLLVVPIFNFAVWSAVRKGYLVRPRLTGLMNGLALGLSASWTTIWIKSVFFAYATSTCKFGWMLLLCASPFLLFAATCLSFDLRNKTALNIRRITTTFSILGGTLSLLFVFTPMVRSICLQSLLNDARQGTASAQKRAISALRSLAINDDLQTSSNPVNGFALAELLVPNRGLSPAADVDRNTFFKITGRPYSEKESEPTSPLVGSKIPGLSLAKSHITGTIDAATLSSSIDWTLTFHNKSAAAQEAIGEIALPKGAAISRVTLWINGEPREGAFASKALTTQAYEAVVNRQRDPLLVTMSAPDRAIFRCSPVPANDGDMKLRIGFKVPLAVVDRKKVSLTLPELLTTDFTQPKRHRINLTSKDLPHASSLGMTTKKGDNGFSISGIVKPSDPIETKKVTIDRGASSEEYATPDWYSKGTQFIVQRIEEVTTPAPKRLFVIVDSSAALRNEVEYIQKVLSEIPKSLKTTVYFQPEKEGNEPVENSAVTAMSREEAQAAIVPDSFIGGQDNGPLLREVVETAAEQPAGAVLWIHGPQPMTQEQPEAPALDLVHRVRLYDMQLAPGQQKVLRPLQIEDTSGLISYLPVAQKSTGKNSNELVASWSTPVKSLCVQRTVARNVPATANLVVDPLISAQVTCLWAQNEAASLLATGNVQRAQKLAAAYRLVTPLTGAVVLENAKEYKAWQLNPGHYVAGNSNETYRGMHQFFNDDVVGNLAGQVAHGLVGAPVDPRFGQSNEVGQLADYGYDTARDIARVITIASLIIALLIAVAFLRSKSAVTGAAIGKAIALVVFAPLIVHLLGTFIINNYGGLGGGL